jgi:hypothetical protein
MDALLGILANPVPFCRRSIVEENK